MPIYANIFRYSFIYTFFILNCLLPRIFNHKCFYPMLLTSYWSKSHRASHRHADATILKAFRNIFLLVNFICIFTFFLRAGEIAFVYQNNKRNEPVNIGEQIIAIHIWKIDEKGIIHLENQAFSTVNLRQWFRLRAIRKYRIRKYSSMFGFPRKNPSLNSQWYIKKISALIWLRAYNHNLACN